MSEGPSSTCINETDMKGRRSCVYVSLKCLTVRKSERVHLRPANGAKHAGTSNGCDVSGFSLFLFVAEVILCFSCGHLSYFKYGNLKKE